MQASKSWRTNGLLERICWKFVVMRVLAGEFDAGLGIDMIYEDTISQLEYEAKLSFTEMNRT